MAHHHNVSKGAPDKANNNNAVEEYHWRSLSDSEFCTGASLTHDTVDEDEDKVEKDDEAESPQEDNTIH